MAKIILDPDTFNCPTVQAQLVQIKSRRLEELVGVYSSPLWEPRTQAITLCYWDGFISWIQDEEGRFYDDKPGNPRFRSHIINYDEVLGTLNTLSSKRPRTLTAKNL